MAPEFVILAPISALVTASVFDLRTREIPDWIPALLFVSGLLAIATGLWPIDWRMAAVGFLVALAVGLVAGLLFDFGGGDVKLVIALGLWLGPVGLLLTVAWTAVFGLGLALIAKARGRKDFAYAPAIAAGLAFQAGLSYLLPRFLS